MRIFVVIAVLLMLSSCCPKCDCVGSEVAITFRVNGFSSEELQTFMVKRYERNTSFSVLMDSFEVRPMFETGTDTLLIFGRLLNENLLAQYDYILHNEHVANDILLSNLSVDYQEGDGCCKCPRYNLKRYTVNNTHQYPDNDKFHLTR